MKMILRFEVETEDENAPEQFVNELLRTVENHLENDFTRGTWGGYEGPFILSARGSRES